MHLDEFIKTTIYYLIIHSNMRLDEFIKTTIYYLIIHNNVRLDEFIKLLFLDNGNAFSLLIIIHQALWPNG